MKGPESVGSPWPHPVDEWNRPEPLRPGRRGVIRVLTDGDDLAADAVLVALGLLLPDTDVEPLSPRLLLANARTNPTSRLRRTHVLVAGGVIGNPALGRLLPWVAGAMRGRPIMVLGAGIDPRLAAAERTSDGPIGWASAMESFDPFSVRDPGSASRLDALGLTAPVVGDPGLLLTPSSPARLDGSTVGLVIGRPPEGGGHARAASGHVISRVATVLSHEGVTVRLLVASENHRREALACAAHIRLSGGGVEIASATDHASFLAEGAECSVVLAERLPPLVLAAAAGVPVVAVGDDAEVGDFMVAIGRSDRLHPDLGLDATEVADSIRSVLVTARFEASEQGRAVEHLRVGLRREGHRIAVRVAG